MAEAFRVPLADTAFAQTIDIERHGWGEMLVTEADHGERALAVAQAIQRVARSLALLTAPLDEPRAFLVHVLDARPARLSSDGVITLKRDLDDALSCLEAALEFIAWIPDEAIEVAPEEGAKAAAAYVSKPARSSAGATVALSWLNAQGGFPALASLLRHDAAMAVWRLPVRRLLEAVRDIDASRAGDLLMRARVHGDTRCCDLASAEADRLADVLVDAARKSD
jgi:hypothetical protein